MALVLISGPSHVAAQGEPPASQTRIAVEEEAGRIIIHIDGEPVVEITENGMHVHGDISFEGVIRDTGEQAPQEGER